MTGERCGIVVENRTPDYRASPTSTQESGRLVNRRVDELKPHPAYVRNHLTVSASTLSFLAERFHAAFVDPLLITRDGTIIDGYARWRLAIRHRRATLPCIEYELNEEEALRWLIRTHGRSNGLNDFCRILLAQDLEAPAKERAHRNRVNGGRNKGLSKLTDAEKIDVRSRIALAAGVSVGNVAKVNQLMTTAVPELIEALRRGVVSIHRAWLLAKQNSDFQVRELGLESCRKAIKKDMRALARRHAFGGPLVIADPRNLMRKLSALITSNPDEVPVVVSSARGRAICITRELMLELDQQQEFWTDAEERRAPTDSDGYPRAVGS